MSFVTRFFPLKISAPKPKNFRSRRLQKPKPRSDGSRKPVDFLFCFSVRLRRPASETVGVFIVFSQYLSISSILNWLVYNRLRFGNFFLTSKNTHCFFIFYRASKIVQFRDRREFSIFYQSVNGRRITVYKTANVLFLFVSAVRRFRTRSSSIAVVKNDSLCSVNDAFLIDFGEKIKHTPLEIRFYRGQRLFVRPFSFYVPFPDGQKCVT